MAYSTDNDIKYVVKQEKEVTAEFVLEEAKQIWKKVKAMNVPVGDSVKAELCMDAIRREHRDFCQAYPIVLRYMAQMGEFRAKAFKQYLAHILHHPWSTEEAFLESQADYVVLLYKATHKKWNTTEISNLRTNIRNMLFAEHNEFKEKVAEMKKIVDEDDEYLTRRRLEELRDWVTKNIDSIDTTVRASVAEDLAVRSEPKIYQLLENVQSDVKVNADDIWA